MSYSSSHRHAAVVGGAGVSGMTRGYLLPSKSDRKKGNRSQWGVRHLTQDCLGVRAQSIVILNVLGVGDHFSGYSRLALLLRPISGPPASTCCFKWNTLYSEQLAELTCSNKQLRLGQAATSRAEECCIVIADL